MEDRLDDATPATAERMPVVFAGHGSPMNALGDSPWSEQFALLGAALPRPTSILAISAHWYVDGSFVTTNAAPETIHDFGGFPRALYEIQYPAPGHPQLAQRVRSLLGEGRVAPSAEWGLDHGTWSVLRWMVPKADVPVVQLSIDRRLEPEAHFELAHSLRSLRDEGVLVFGSGNIVHNLRDAFPRMRSGSTETPGWAHRYDEATKQALLGADPAALLALPRAHPDGPRAHPTPDHWLPLIYAAGATDERDSVQFPIEGFDLGSISMRCMVWS